MEHLDYSIKDIVFQGETVGHVEGGVFYSNVKSKHNTMVSLDRVHLELARQAGAKWVVITDRTGAARKALIEDCEQPGYVNGAFPWAMAVPLSIFSPMENSNAESMQLVRNVDENGIPTSPGTATHRQEEEI